MPDLFFDLPTQPADTRSWGNLSGSATSLAVHHAISQQAGLTLVITPDSSAADQLERELVFFRADSGYEVLSFPDWETLPYDSFSPHQDIISQRLTTLYRLPQVTQGVLIVPITTLLHRLPPQSFVVNNSLLLKVDEIFAVQATRQRLAAAGYRQVDTVHEHGEFAVRGAIMDIFPMGSTEPVRIDLFDDEIEQLRLFDPETQLTTAQVNEITLLPAKEFPFDEQAIVDFRQHWRSRFEGEPGSCPTYQDVSNGIATAGLEYYLPLFFDACASLLDYLPEQTLICTTGDIRQASEHFQDEIKLRYEDRRYDIERPILAADRNLSQPGGIVRPPETLAPAAAQRIRSSNQGRSS